MDRFRTSWALLLDSWRVLRSNPSLSIFPIVSTIATLVVTAAFFVPIALTSDLTKIHDKSDVPVAWYIVTFLFYLVNYFIVTFFNSALMFCAHRSLYGESATVGDGISMAMKRLPQIFAWSMVSATVGMILRTIGERAGIVGQIVTSLLGAAWNIVTYFTIPALVIEGAGPIDAIKRSWDTIKRTWGESLIAGVGLSYATFVLALIPVLPLVGALVSGSVPIIVAVTIISVLYWLVLATIGASLTSIFRAAVYAYARTGSSPVGFSADSIQSAFVPKKPGFADKFRRRF